MTSPQDHPDQDAHPVSIARWIRKAIGLLLIVCASIPLLFFVVLTTLTFLSVAWEALTESRDKPNSQSTTEINNLQAIAAKLRTYEREHSATETDDMGSKSIDDFVSMNVLSPSDAGYLHEHNVTFYGYDPNNPSGDAPLFEMTFRRSDAPGHEFVSSVVGHHILLRKDGTVDKTPITNGSRLHPSPAPGTMNILPTIPDWPQTSRFMGPRSSKGRPGVFTRAASARLRRGRR
jgi:hypothetical protein